MKIFTVKEIIEYAIKIENESFNFYTEASKKVEAGDVKDLLVKLSSEEIDHQNRLKGLIDEEKVAAETLLKKMEIDTTIMEKIVETSVIPDNPTAMSVLKVALEREKNTELTYSMLMTLTQISDDIVGVFDELRLQEIGHARKIGLRIEAIA